MENRILNKLDQIDAKIGDLNTKVALMEAQLNVNFSRMNIIEDDVKPIKKQITRVENIMWFITACAGALASLKHLLG